MPGLEIVRCPVCGTGATLPPPDRDVRGDGLFTDADAGYSGRRLEMREQWFHEARLRMRWMQSTLPHNARLMEIGSATGEFVSVAERAGHDVVGLETSSGAVEQSRAVTTGVVALDLTEWLRGGALVDAVAMFHVLEHVPDPVEFLQEVRTALRPGGMAYLEVPNGGSYSASKDGVHWWAARTEDHFFHFTERGLRGALERAGLDVLEIRAVHRDVYTDRATRLRGAAKDVVRPLVGKGRRSLDLLRAVARRPS